MGNFFFLNYQSCTFFNRLSFQLVLYICILYVYNSNRDILPGVNACLFTVERKKTKAVQLSVMNSSLSALCSFKTLTGRDDALLHTVDLWSKGFLLHYSCCDLIMLISCSFGLWRCTGLYSQSDANWFTLSCQLRPITDVAAFLLCSSLLSSGVKWDGSLIIRISHGQFDFVIVLCIIETFKLRCMLSLPHRVNASDHRSRSEALAHLFVIKHCCFIQDDMVLFHILRPN